MSGVDVILIWIRANRAFLSWLAPLSVLTFIGTLIAIPILVIHIPEGYFLHEKRKPVYKVRSFSGLRILYLILKNIIGILFLISGLAMLLLPGQGLLTILIGLMLMDFPGKYALERRIIHQEKILSTINWLRAKARRPPVQVKKERMGARSKPP